ncbi:MAG: hypothetical protein ACRETL_09905 [Gammaproteobacteria bacterium]
MYWSPMEHLFQVCLMGVLIFGAQAFARRIQSARSRNETHGLRGGLAVSLKALRNLYSDNLNALVSGKSLLLSGRQQINLLRILLGRLLRLERIEVEAVISACIAAETAEAAMAVVGKQMGGVSFAIPEPEDERVIVESTLLRSCSMLDAAMHLLDPAGTRADDEARELTIGSGMDDARIHDARIDELPNTDVMAAKEHPSLARLHPRS